MGSYKILSDICPSVDVLGSHSPRQDNVTLNPHTTT